MADIQSVQAQLSASHDDMHQGDLSGEQGDMIESVPDVTVASNECFTKHSAQFVSEITEPQKSDELHHVNDELCQEYDRLHLENDKLCQTNLPYSQTSSLLFQ